MRLISALAALTMAAMVLLLASYSAQFLGPLLEAGTHMRGFAVGCNLFVLFCMLAGALQMRRGSRDATSLWRRTDRD